MMKIVALTFAVCCNGLCVQEDCAIWSSNPAQWMTSFEKIARSSMGVKSRAVRLFQTSYPAMTTDCVVCQADMAHCGAKHCSSKCMLDKLSEKCIQCVEEKCIPGYHACIGKESFTILPPRPWEQ